MRFFAKSMLKEELILRFAFTPKLVYTDIEKNEKIWILFEPYYKRKVKIPSISGPTSWTWQYDGDYITEIVK